MRRAALLVFLVATLLSGLARAEAELPTANFGGYFRIMARPDLQGGDGTLGFSNLYGRLLNERPFAALELRLNLLKPRPGTNDPWTAIHFKVEGGALQNATPSGSFGDMRLSQAYVLVGNVVQDVTFQLGTLDSWFGDLGLYDIRPAQVFFETAGISARYQKGPSDGMNVDVLLGAGDSGYFIRGGTYSPIPTFGGTARLHINNHFELGGGGQFMYEPRVVGNPNAPHFTEASELDYENFIRGEVTQRFLEANPGQLQSFPNPTARDSISFKGIGYVGFGGFGPLRWSNLFVSYGRRHPEQRKTEIFDFLLDGNRVSGSNDLYITHLTDERYELIAGNEMQLTVWPGVVDLTWSVLWIEAWDLDNTVAPSEQNKQTASTVARAQVYLTDTFHLLGETSFAWEFSKQGNLWRQNNTSIFESTEGRSDARGLEFGDLDTRNTWQGKAGIVINPLGKGIYLRPSIRLLYGVQYSNQNRAYNNNFVDNLDQFNVFGGQEIHLHHVFAIETEAWF
jgi:hypothetical protein